MNRPNLTGVLVGAALSSAAIGGALQLSPEPVPRLKIVADFSAVFSAPGDFVYVTSPHNATAAIKRAVQADGSVVSVAIWEGDGYVLDLAPLQRWRVERLGQPAFELSGGVPSWYFAQGDTVVIEHRVRSHAPTDSVIAAWRHVGTSLITVVDALGVEP